MPLATFVHDLDPILARVGPVYLWWYGLSYALGFLQLHWYLARERHRLSLSRADVQALTLSIAVGVLAGGRLVEVAFDEWPFYRQHLSLIPALWLGGMATHGLLLGAAVATAAFAYARRMPFLELADALVVPGALLMGLGRIGNFIDGQIVGAPTDAWWGVQFPDAAGARHAVVLYDGAKNLVLVGYLLWVRRTNPTPGAVAARFVFWYAFPRIFIDLFRDYPTHRLALGTGQTLNILMSVLGVALLIRSRMRRLGGLSLRRMHRPRKPVPGSHSPAPGRPAPLALRAAFALVLAFCLTIPSNWTQNVPERYGRRHPGLERTWLYPQIATGPPREGGAGIIDAR